MLTNKINDYGVNSIFPVDVIFIEFDIFVYIMLLIFFKWLWTIYFW